MCNFGKCFQVHHFLVGIADDFGIDAAAVPVNGGFNCFEVGKVDELALHSEAPESLGNQQPGVSEQMVG